MANVYVYKDKQGVITFTNVLTHQGFRRVIREGNATFSSPELAATSYEGLIRQASNRHNVDAALIRAVIKVESDFDSSARSHKGAQRAAMQLMPETARLHNVRIAYDPSANIEGGVSHLKLTIAREAIRAIIEVSRSPLITQVSRPSKSTAVFRHLRRLANMFDGCYAYYQTYRGERSLQVMQ